jgi:hypothetical protein
VQHSLGLTKGHDAQKKNRWNKRSQQDDLADDTYPQTLVLP